MFAVLGKRLCPLERTFSLQCRRTLRRRSIPYSIEDPYFSRVFSESLSSARSSNEKNYNWNTDSTEEPWSATPLHGKLHLHTFCRLCWRSTERCNVVVDRPYLCWAASVDAIVEDLKLKNSNTAADHEGRLFHFWCSLPKNSENSKEVPFTIFVAHTGNHLKVALPWFLSELAVFNRRVKQLASRGECDRARAGRTFVDFDSKFFFVFSIKATRGGNEKQRKITLTYAKKFFLLFSCRYSLRWLGQSWRHTQPRTDKHTHQSCPWFKKLYKVLTAPHATNQHTLMP